MTMYLPGPKVFVTFSPESHPQFVAHPTSFVSDKPVCLAKILSAQKMARFALCLGLKREPGLGQELL
jgi:hypothetical protein